MKLAPRIALACAAVIVALELALRLVHPPMLSVNWLYDPLLGHRGPRNFTAPLFSLPGVHTQYNSYGFRGEDPTPRSAGAHPFSVFVLGDSITEAIQVPWRNAFVPRLEALLRAKLGGDAEVTNWALSDYGTANELLVYASDARHLRPDVVLLQFLGLNDFVNNTLAFAGRNRSLSDFVRPYLVPESERGKLAVTEPLGPGLPFTYPHPAWKWWREHSRLAAYADYAWHRREWNRKLNPPPGAAAEPCPVESEVFLDEPAPGWAEAYDVTARLAKALREQVERTGDAHGKPPRLIAFYVPSRFELSADEWRTAVAPALSHCTTKGFHPENPEKRFLELFRAAGVEAVSLTKDLSHSGLPTERLYLPDGHFSSEGHRVVAESLQRLLLAAPSRASSRQR